MEMKASFKCIEDFRLGNLNKEQFLALVVETANELGWSIKYASANGIIAFSNEERDKIRSKIIIMINPVMARIQSEMLEHTPADIMKNKEVVERFLFTHRAIRRKFTDEDLTKQFSLIQPMFDQSENEEFKIAPQTFKENTGEIAHIFTPRAGYFITPIIVDLNVLVLVVMALSGVNILNLTTPTLLDWGANLGTLSLNGQWWRLLTACFLHGSILHLAFNMFAFVFIGSLLEPIMGKAKFIISYLATGICASLMSVFWHDQVTSVGASGAIFGMYGVFVGLIATNSIHRTTKKYLLWSMLIFVSLSLLGGMEVGIDNAAHIGGLVSGLVLGVLFSATMKKRTQLN